MLRSILCHNACRCDPHNVAQDWLDVLLHQCLKVAVTRGDSPASGRPFGNDEGFQFLISRTHSSVHFFGDNFSKLVRELGTLFVHSEETIDLGLDTFPEIEVVVRVGAEFLFIFTRECVLTMSRVDIGS